METESSSSKHFQLRDEFRIAWESGQQPSLIEFLEKIDESDRWQLVELLLPIDIEFRQRQKDFAGPSTYSILGERAVDVAKKLLDDQRTVNQETLAPSHAPENKGTPEARTQAPSDAPIKARRISPYKLLQEIGEGGMGTVWMAEQEHPVRRRVALKVIKAGMDSKQVIARFEAERQAIAMMDHQNIAKVLDAATAEDGSPYFVMELVKGIPLTDYCDRNRLSIRERLELFIPVCRAVQHAHQKGILHRDLKPSNVLVTLYDGKPVPKVIDFGLAKALEQQSKLTDKTMFTEFGKVVGTLQYMAPEQAEMNSLDVDTRTDIYSLGAILYELLTGSTPLDKETLQKNALLQVISIIREKEPPRPSLRLSSTTAEITGISEQRRIAPAKLQQILRGDLDWIVMKALDIDRTRRYESASGLAADIERYLNDETILARPPSVKYRVGKFVKKNRGLVITAATILVLLIAGISATTWFALVADSARKDAVVEKTRSNEKAREARLAKIRADAETEKATDAQFKLTLALEKSEATLARSKYFLARSLWNESRIREAIDVLHQVPPNRRNIEWHLTWRQFQGSSLTLHGHADPVLSVAFSADGKKIVTGGADKKIKIWDATTGAELQSIDGHENPVTYVHFLGDGSKVVSGSPDGTVKTWDWETGQPFKSFSGLSHASPVSMSIDPTNSEIVLVDINGVVRFLNPKTLEETRPIFQIPIDIEDKFIFDLRNHILVSGTMKVGGDIVYRNCRNGGKIHTMSVNSELGSQTMGFAVSPDGRILASGHNAGTILWDVVSGKKLHELVGTSREWIEVLAFSPTSETLATEESDHSITLWNVRSGDQGMNYRGHLGAVKDITFSPDGKRFATASNDRTVKIWDVRDEPHRIGTFSSSDPRDRRASVSKSGDWVARIEDDRKIVLRETVGEKRHFTMSGHEKTVYETEFSPDRTMLASRSADNTVRIWNVSNGSELVTFRAHDKIVNEIIFSSDSTRIATASNDRSVKIWDPRTGRMLKDFKELPGQANRIDFSGDGKKLVVGCLSQILVFDISTGKLVQTIDGSNWFVGVSTNHDGSLVAALQFPEGLRVLHRQIAAERRFISEASFWNTESAQKINLLSDSAGQNIRSIFFTADKKNTRIISSSLDHSIKIWDRGLGQELLSLQFPKSQIAELLDTEFDGETISNVYMTGTVCNWDVRSRHEIQIPYSHSTAINSLAFNADGTAIHVNGRDGKRITIDRSTGKILADNPDWSQVSFKKSCYSKDGKWLAIPYHSQVRLIDLDLKNLRYQRTKREQAASIDALWHVQQASYASSQRDYFGTLFHLAWILRSESASQKSEYKQDTDRLPTIYELWKKEFAKELEERKKHAEENNWPIPNTNPDDYLPPIVKSVLAEIKEEQD